MEIKLTGTVADIKEELKVLVKIWGIDTVEIVKSVETPTDEKDKSARRKPKPKEEVIEDTIEKSGVTFSELQTRVSGLVKAKPNLKQSIKEALKECGSSRLKQLDEGRYEEYMQKLDALEAE